MGRKKGVSTMAPAVVEDQNEFDEAQPMDRVESLARDIFVRLVVSRTASNTDHLASTAIEAAIEFYQVLCPDNEPEPEEPTETEPAESNEPEAALTA